MAKNTTNSLIDSTFLAIAIEVCLLRYTNSFKKAVFVLFIDLCAVETKEDEVVNVINQWVGLCFYSCVYKLCRPPALILELSLDEKQKIILLWPNNCIWKEYIVV
jgi:hypothetical protein